jgi:hypothetical protein
MLILAAIICAVLAIILLLIANLIDHIRRLVMTVAALQDLIAALGVSVDALIAKVGTQTPPEDLQPVADALAAVKAKVDAAVAG